MNRQDKAARIGAKKPFGLRFLIWFACTSVAMFLLLTILILTRAIQGMGA